MKKRRIVLASILKPVNDTRMTDKMARSLAAVGSYDVHVIGFPAVGVESTSNITFHPLLTFGRISLGRVAARWKVLKITLRLKPEVLIVNTHELLIVGIANRILFGTRFIYDIQENYGQNIRLTRTFPRGVRLLLAAAVRAKEWMVAPFVSQFLLAEKCYVDQLPFARRGVIVENKSVVPPDYRRTPNPEVITLLFSGTLAESTGALEAIRLAAVLHAREPRIRLHLIGYCSQPGFQQQLDDAVATHPFVTIDGGRTLVPHARIVNAIGRASFGIVFYPPSPHVDGKIPTKLYEYLALGLPLLLQPDPDWLALCAAAHAAIPVDFYHPDVDTILRAMQGPFYSQPATGVTWAEEEPKLLAAITGVF